MFKSDCGEHATRQSKVKTALKLKTNQVPTNNFWDLRNVNFWQRLNLYIGQKKKKNPLEFESLSSLGQSNNKKCNETKLHCKSLDHFSHSSNLPLFDWHLSAFP